MNMPTAGISDSIKRRRSRNQGKEATAAKQAHKLPPFPFITSLMSASTKMEKASLAFDKDPKTMWK